MGLQIPGERLNEPLALTAEFGDADQRVVYVATTGEDGEGRGSAAAPYATVNAAVAALGTLGTATGTVVVAEGDYELTDTLSLTNAVRIVGAGMYKTTLKRTLIKGVNGVKAGSRGVYLNHAGAWMGGLTVTECSSKGLDGSGIYMDKGTLDGVRSYANRSGLGEYTTPNPGVGLYMAGGLATNCVIEANVQDGGYGARYGAGLAMSSGLFTDGKVLNNVCNRNQSSGLGVHVCGASAIVRNSLIMGNNAGSYQPGDHTYGMGVFMTQNGLVENCRIVGNSVQGVYMTSGTLRNCLVTGHENSSTSYSAGVDVRGGTGLFAGRLPLVFFTNMPTNSGMIQQNPYNAVTTYNSDGTVKSSNPTLDKFKGGLVTDPNQIRDLLGAPATITPEQGTVAKTIGGVDRDFKMPQVWKTSVAVDYQVPVSFPLTLTAEFIYTKKINDVMLDNYNIKNNTSEWEHLNGADNRLIYPKDFTYYSNINDACVLTNTHKGHGYTFNITATAEPIKNLNVMAAYTHTVMKEISGMPGSNASSAWSGLYTVNGPNFSTLQNSAYVIPDRLLSRPQNVSCISPGPWIPGLRGLQLRHLQHLFQGRTPAHRALSCLCKPI